MHPAGGRRNGGTQAGIPASGCRDQGKYRPLSPAAGNRLAIPETGATDFFTPKAGGPTPRCGAGSANSTSLEQVNLLSAAWVKWKRGALLPRIQKEDAANDALFV